MIREPVPPVHLALFDTFADWESGHATAHLALAGYQVRTVAPTAEPVTGIGGLRVLPDLALDALRPGDSSLLILSGGTRWDEGDDLAPFARTARAFLDAGVPVAAICGATAGLAREGLLDERAHTSGAAPYLAMTGYAGGARYVEADAVTDGGLVTAGPTEPVAFAREILRLLGAWDDTVIDAWYRLFHDSDPEAYAVYAQALAR
ncbi:DJ-1/PfpI family protein [Streptomyces sp. NPDC007904]|jgi:putative intracellular protease/amidase|uniref:type 1 glutamine amidotransferase family protein n=1 Tax=Streptomyces sp. NPDC007904 TaxID=3364787 RepID=UPI0036E1E68A